MLRSVAALLLGGLLLCTTGCKKDPNTPAYWDAALKKAHSTPDKLRVLNTLTTSSFLALPVVPVLQAHLVAEKSPPVKAALARALGMVKDASSVPPLIGAIDISSSATEVQSANREIVTALSNLADPTAIPALLPLLHNSDPFTRVNAIDALGKLKAKEAVEPLMKLAADGTVEPLEVRRAILALGDIGDTRALPLLVQMLYQERGALSFYQESAFALFAFGKPAVDALLPVLDGKDAALNAWAKEQKISDGALFAKAAQVLGDLDDASAERSLLARLAFQAADPAQRLFVRMMAASALGRMHSHAGAKALESMVDETEPMARMDYLRALAFAGGPDSAPAVASAAAKGPWELREPTLATLGLLAADVTATEKVRKDERAKTAAECKQSPGDEGCQKVEDLTLARLKAVDAAELPIRAAEECKADMACWAKKLDENDVGVRRRAALELGKHGKGADVKALLSHLTEKELETRLYIIQAANFLVDHDAGAATAARDSLPALDKQLADERGKSEFSNVSEELHRLLARLLRKA